MEYVGIRQTLNCWNKADTFSSSQMCWNKADIFSSNEMFWNKADTILLFQECVGIRRTLFQVLKYVVIWNKGSRNRTDTILLLGKVSALFRHILLLERVSALFQQYSVRLIPTYFTT